MPTYVYRCKNCEHQFETVQRITEEPKKECPECKGTVTRLLFPVGIVFKGSGFHVNDYPSSKSSVGDNGKKPEDKTDTKKDDKTDTKKETTPAAKD